MKELSIFSAQRSTSFQILYCVLVRFSRTSNRTMHGNKDSDGSNHLRNTETLTELTVSQWNSSGIFSKDSIRCSSVKKSKVYCWDKARHQKLSQAGLYSSRCSTTSPVDQKTMNKNAGQMPISFLYMQKDLEQDNGHFLVLVLKRSGILSVKIVHKRMRQNGGQDDVGIRRKRTSNFLCYKPIVQKSAQKQRPWKIVDTLCSRPESDWDFFSHNHFCKSAQSSRSSRRNVWRIRNSSRHCGRTIEFLIRAKRDLDRSAFGLWSPC